MKIPRSTASFTALSTTSSAKYAKTGIRSSRRQVKRFPMSWVNQPCRLARSSLRTTIVGTRSKSKPEEMLGSDLWISLSCRPKKRRRRESIVGRSKQGMIDDRLASSAKLPTPSYPASSMRTLTTQEIVLVALWVVQIQRVNLIPKVAWLRISQLCSGRQPWKPNSRKCWSGTPSISNRQPKSSSATLILQIAPIHFRLCTIRSRRRHCRSSGQILRSASM